MNSSGYTPGTKNSA